MSASDRPAWLVRQEHGAIAEARTRAFLLDRFWILERSVDVEGADFIIQRRLTTRSLLDRNAPRLGFVQAKFFQDSNTTQYVHREYVIDTLGRPRAEFFLLCHSGLEDSLRAFFLTATEIAESFTVTPESHSKPNRFELPGRVLLMRRYEILDRRRILEQIEQSLKNADFAGNRQFMSWALPSLDERRGPIRAEYIEQIDNNWGDIPEAFEELRENARKALSDVTAAAILLDDIATTDDPEIALSKAKELYDEFEGRVTFGDIFCSDDFLSVVQHHRHRYEQLQSAGLLGAHAALRRMVKTRILSDVVPRMPLARDVVYVIVLRFEPTTFALVDFEAAFEVVDALDLPQHEWAGETRTKESGVLKQDVGFVRAFVIPGRHGYVHFVRGGTVPDERPWAEKFERVAEYLTSAVMTAILETRFDTQECEGR